MKIKVTYFLDVLSSWCHWAEPAWATAKERFTERADFDWQIALIPPEGFSASLSFSISRLCASASG